MKLCGLCKETKPFTEFHRRGQGYQSWCKPCKKAKDRADYKANKDYNIERARQSRKERRDWYHSLKSGRCTDCGVSYPYYVMQWDHIGTDKEFNIADKVYWCSKQRILEEIAKCELVCANCHAIRTHTRIKD